MRVEVEVKLPDEAREFMRALYLRHHREMFRIVRLMGVPDDLASEAVVRTLTTAWQKHTPPDRTGPPIPWLMETLRQHARNLRRADRRHHRRFETTDLHHDDLGPDDHASAEDHAHLDRLLAGLDDDERAAVIHRAIYGGTQDETAEVMKSTPDRVRGLYERALAKLAKVLRRRGS
jgi:RNA polymerase sigma factor (sigma-70 family)